MADPAFRDRYAAAATSAKDPEDRKWAARQLAELDAADGKLGPIGAAHTQPGPYRDGYSMPSEPNAEPPPPDEPVDMLEAGARGLLQGALPYTNQIISSAATGGGGFAEANAAAMPYPNFTGGRTISDDRADAAKEARPAYEKELQLQRERDAQAFKEHPYVTTAGGMAGFLAGPGKFLKGAGKVAQAAVGGGKTLLDTMAAGGSGKDVAKNTAVSTGLGFLAPFAGSIPFAGPVIGALGERVQRVVDEGRIGAAFEEPEAMALPAATALAMHTIAAGGRKAKSYIADTKTKAGRNIVAAEKVPGVDVTALKGISGKPINDYAEGDYGIGQASSKGAKNALDVIESKRKIINSEYGKGEDALLAKSAGQRVDATPLIREIDQQIQNKKLSDGTPLSDADVNELSGLRAKFIDVKTVAGKPFPVPKDLTVKDLIKIRRSADEAGHAGRVAGKDDVPYRAVSGLLRDNLIPLADPDLAAHMRQHHKNLSTLEKAHGTLVLREDAAIDPTQSLQERATRRVGAFGMSDLPGDTRQRAIREAIAGVDRLKTPGEDRRISGPIREARAVRAREETSFGTQPIQSVHGAASVSQAAGGLLSSGNIDATKTRIYGGIKSAQKQTHIPAALMMGAWGARPKKPKEERAKTAQEEK